MGGNDMKNNTEDKYKDKSLFRRVVDMIVGLRKPKWTPEYKLARLELQRMSAPLTAILIPSLVAVVLCVVTAVARQDVFEFPIVEIPDVEEEDAQQDFEEPPIPPDAEQPTSDETPEFEVDAPTVDVAIVDPAPISQPSTQTSIRPADSDSVSMINSPVRLRCVTGGRNPGMIGGMTKGGVPGHGDPSTEATVMKVLWWLKAHQNTDGSWGNANKVANTALAVLTYLAHGEYPGSESPYRREFGPVVMSALDYIIGALNVDASNVPHFNGTDGNEYSFLLGTYALCEAYGMTKNPNCKEAAMTCLYRIVENQSSTGGWDYKLNKNSTRDDLSYAGWAIQALKAGKMAGLHPEGLDQAINKAIDCLKRRSYSKSSGFTYTPTANNNGGNTGLAGVGALAMQLLGRGGEPEVRNALDVMEDWKPEFDPDQISAKKPGGSPQYYCYYATQCKYQAGMKPGALKKDEEIWVKWNTAMKRLYPKSIIDVPEPVLDTSGKPHKQGYYENKDAHSTRPYMDTCLVALQLMVYYRYLPTTSVSAGAEDEKPIELNKDFENGEIKVNVDF